MVVFLCGEETDAIWCGIYDAWMSRLGHENVRLEPCGWDRELFCDYRMVETSPGKAEKVTDSIRRKISEEVYEWTYKAALSQDRLRADKIYRFLIYAFHFGPKIMNMLHIPAVYDLFSMNRNIQNEYDHLRGFVRFSRMKEGILLGKIGPKNDMTVLLAPHFADRLPDENWILYDCGRSKAAVHQGGMGWVMVNAASEEWQARLNRATDEAEYEDLWRIFQKTIAIRERTNLKCQMTMLPLRFRPYMLEFK